MPKVDHEKIIADYMAAYRETRGADALVSIRYERGWFVIGSGGIFPSEYCYRAAAIVEMTGRLRASAAEKDRTK